MATTRTTESGTFTAEERAAMKERAGELRTSGRTKGAAKAAAELKACLDAIAAMPDDDRKLAGQVHEIVTENAPDIAPKTWYGMPAYAMDGKVVCFFQPATKFRSRYATFGFNDVAKLDDGTMWPTAWALTVLTTKLEAELAALVRKAVG